MNKSITISKIENGYLITIVDYGQNGVDEDYYSPKSNHKQYYAENTTEIGQIIQQNIN